jgi:hypothetical protein
MNYVQFAVQTARETFTPSPTTDPSGILIESLSIVSDAMPHHFIAQARILDLQPNQMVPAMMAVEQQIRGSYPHMRSTGWRGASDGLRIYFMAWTSNGGVR